jgi:hypothetical protein
MSPRSELFPLEPSSGTTNRGTPSNKTDVARRYLVRLQTIARELFDYELYREATDLFRYLTVVSPTNPSNWYWLGRCLVCVGDPLNAARVFELGGRLSHVGTFAELAADAWRRAGLPDKAQAALHLRETVQ